jgi:hypothetical protein
MAIKVINPKTPQFRTTEAKIALFEAIKTYASTP